MSVDWSESMVFTALDPLAEEVPDDVTRDVFQAGPPMPDEVEPPMPDDPDEAEFLDYFEQLPETKRRARRDELMLLGLEAGLTLQAAGDLYGITRERVRQIAAAAGVATKDIRQRKAAQADRRRRRIARHVYGISLTHPELTIQELAEWADTDEATVRAALEHRVAVHEVKYNDWSPGTSDGELIAALKEWAQDTASPTGDSYSAWAARRGLPGKQIPTMRFGSWNNALRRAGLHGLVTDRGGPRPTMSDDMLWAGVLQFFRDDLPGYSFQAYDAYWRDLGLASAATLRARLGSWSDIKARVRQLMRYAAAPDGEWGWADGVLGVDPEEEQRNVVSEETCMAALRAVAASVLGPLTVQVYEDARASGQPNAGLIQRRFGSWVDALHQSGLASRMSARGRRKWAERAESSQSRT